MIAQRQRTNSANYLCEFRVSRLLTRYNYVSLHDGANRDDVNLTHIRTASCLCCWDWPIRLPKVKIAP